MDMTRSTLTKPSAVREVVYSRSRMSRKGIPGKNRQKKEAGQNSVQFAVRGGQLRKLRWQRILILRLFLLSRPGTQLPLNYSRGLLPTSNRLQINVKTGEF